MLCARTARAGMLPINEHPDQFVRTSDWDRDHAVQETDTDRRCSMINHISFARSSRAERIVTGCQCHSFHSPVACPSKYDRNRFSALNLCDILFFTSLSISANV